MEKLVNNAVMHIARGNIDKAAAVLDLQTITTHLERHPSIDFNIPNLEGLQGFAQLKSFIQTLLKLQLFRVKSAANLFKDDQENVISIYAEVLSALGSSEILRRDVSFFRNIIVQCKRDMKVYWRLPVRSLERQIETVISELRSLFTEYKRSEFSKGVIVVLSNLFWFYFKINQFEQCTFLIKSLKDQVDRFLSETEKSYQVTYYYYVGKLKVYEGQHEEAARCLEKAFELCHSRFRAHKLKIFRLLVPFKMILGKFPSPSLLNQFNLTEFLGLIQAVKQGNLKAFEEEKKKNRRLWVKRGIYFLLDNVELVLLRRICKIVWLLNGKKTIIPTEHFQKAFNLRSTYKYDLHETECIIGNLIMKGFIRGVVYPEQKKAVFPAENAFPSLGSN